MIIVAFKNDKTRTFTIKKEREREIKNIVQTVYSALLEKGYDPVNQISGYILTQDPTYITNHNNARSLICKIDRDELMDLLISNYLGIDY
jgi:uncharacterized protein (UPF0297 family)